MSDEWVAAYYPSDLVEDQRLKTIFCLLFDRVVCHFPIANMGCGGGCGISGAYCDDPLVDEGVLDLREEFLLSEIDCDFSPGHPWGTDEEFGRYHDLNVAGMALNCCQTEGAVPATSNPSAPIPVEMLTRHDVPRDVEAQAAALAIQSLDIALPPLATLRSEEILEARGLLAEQLIPFRRAMYALAPAVRSGIEAGASLDEIGKEAEYQAKTVVIPRLEEMKKRLALEKGRFWRKLVMRVAGDLPAIVLKWATGAGTAAAVDAAKLASGAAGQIVENETFANLLLSGGGLGYLISAESTVSRLVEKREQGK